MTHGKEVAKELRKGRGGGIPWSVFLAPDGTEIITTDAKGPGKGNIGFPVQPEEIAHFMVMLKKAQEKMTDEDLATVKAALVANSAKLKAARERARRAREQKKR
jgi:hypothetical protein